MDITLTLTPAEQSALECAGLEEADFTTEDQKVLSDAWFGKRLIFDPSEADQIRRAVNELSNDEDNRATDRDEDPEMRKFARRASMALSRLMQRIG